MSPDLVKMLEMARWAIVCVAAVLMVSGLFKILLGAGRPGQGGQGIFLMVGGLLIGGAAVVSGFVVEGFTREPGADQPGPPTPTPHTVSPTPNPSPAPTGKPAEIPWDALPAAAVGILIVVGALGVGVAVIMAGSVALSHRRERIKRRNRLIQRWHDAQRLQHSVFERWSRYELDFQLVFDYPAMTDISVPQTAAFHHAQRAVQRAQLEEFTGADKAELEHYEQAVSDYEQAFLVAERHARAVRWNLIPAQDQRILEEMRQVLNIAQDGATPDHQRRTLFHRLTKLAEKVSTVTFPRPAMEQLEKHSAPSLTTTPWTHS